MNKCNVRHIPEGFYADEVRPFATAMIKQLRDNEHIGHWPSYEPSIDELHLRFTSAWEQLKKAHAEEDYERVAELSADLGNFSMKTFTLYGKMRPDRG